MVIATLYAKSKNMSNKNIKILIATGIFPPDIGGPATYCEKLLNELPKHGFDVTLITYADKIPKTEEKNIIRISRDQNIFLRYLKYFWQCYKLTKNVDVVYAHDLISVGIPCAIVRLLRLKLKLIIRLGGDFLWEKAYNNAWTNKPLSQYYLEKKNIREKLYLSIFRFVMLCCDKIIFSTEWQKTIYLKTFKIANNKIIVIQNPLPNKNNQSKGSTTVVSKPKTLLYAGRLIKLKNIPILIEAMQKIPDMHLKIIGDGPEKNNLKNLIDKRNLSGRITVLHAISHDKLAQEIINSYLVVIPSITDISPNLAMEALGAHKPVLLTLECGFYNVFKDLIFFNPASINDLQEKIIYLNDPVNYETYLKKIKQIDFKRSWENLIQDHTALFKNLIATNR